MRGSSFVSHSPSGGSDRLGVTELFGLRPLGATLAQAKLVFFGDPGLPRSRFDTTSLRLMTPRLSVATWRGERVAGRTVPVLTLFNRTPTPVSEGWSVRVTQARDFRGRGMTYDSHNGTDFVMPPGTKVAASAAGRVVTIRREFNRGGLKVYLDHGEGLMSSYHHLGRALVEVGDLVLPGQVIALSAYSGADGLLTFPWVAPHVHYNAYVGGVLVDPFAADGERSIWVAENAPRPADRESEQDFTPTVFEPDRVEALLADLSDPRRRRELSAIADPTLRGFATMVEANTYPTRFATAEAGHLLYPEEPKRRSRLHLPLRREDFDEAAFCDDLGLRR